MLQADAHEARSRLAALVKAQEQQRAEGNKRVAAAKAAAAAEREALQARHAAKVSKLQEAARDQVMRGRAGNRRGKQRGPPGGLAPRSHSQHCPAPLPPLTQIRSLRTKLTDSRGAVEQLRAQLKSLKDAELSMLRSSVERPLSALGELQQRGLRGGGLEPACLL